MNYQYCTREGIFNDSKPTLKEDEFKAKVKNNMNTYDKEFLEEFNKSKEIKNEQKS